MAACRAASSGRATSGHVQRRAPKAKVRAPLTPGARQQWRKGESTPCVLKPGTKAWARLWPRLTDPDPGDHDMPDELLPRRPRTRAECCNVPRPCPFLSCPYHRYLSVNPQNGSIWLNCPDVLPWEMQDSCLLDLIEQRGALTLAAVGKLHHLTKERMRQVEQAGLDKLRALYTEADRG
jgi:hypothetical protein